jgi:hypothetical protein
MITAETMSAARLDGGETTIDALWVRCSTYQFGIGSGSGAMMLGALAVDSANGGTYFRYGGGWHYVNQTAGFEVPAHERSCPVCSESLLPGDDLIGRGDRKEPHGALRGL